MLSGPGSTGGATISFEVSTGRDREIEGDEDGDREIEGEEVMKMEIEK